MLLLFALAACSEAETEDPVLPQPRSVEPTKAARPASAAPLAESSNAAEELAMLSTRVCLPQLDGSQDSSSEALTAAGYRLQSSAISRQMLGRVDPALIAARKTSPLGTFLVAFGGPLPHCVVMLTDQSTRPSLPELQSAFYQQGWNRSGTAAVAPDKPFDGFERVGANGNRVFALVDIEPENDRSVRLAIQVQRVSN